MKKLISCKYHENSQTVELLYKDGTLIDIDCMSSRTKLHEACMKGQSETILSIHDLVRYTEQILNGAVKEYLRNATDYRPLFDRSKIAYIEVSAISHHNLWFTTLLLVGIRLQGFSDSGNRY